MSLSVGIVGLPNVGKSTLFNALLKRQQALAANYPFATVEPNVGVVEVPDIRLRQLAEVIAGEGRNQMHPVKGESRVPAHLPPLKPATIEFVDIAGLVAGASKGEGLGNKFLANIRECDLICHVLRAFRDGEVVLTGKLDPAEDLETVRLELIFKDLETVTRSREAKTKDQKEKQLREAVFPKLISALEVGKMANTVEISPEEFELVVKPLSLLTMKPEIFVMNISEEQLTHPTALQNQVAPLTIRGEQNANPIGICAKIESELAELSEIERQEYLAELGQTQSGIERMAQVAYQKLGLLSFLTAGEIECRAWTIKQGTTAQQASGVIHTDFAKKFIKAQVIDWQLFVELGGWKQARDAGKVRQEGRDYVMQDGDVVEFMIGR